MIVRCPACKGQKQVFKIGLIKKDCATCNGTGLVTANERDEIMSKVKAHTVTLDEAADSLIKSQEQIQKQGCCEDGSTLRKQIKKNR